MRCKVIIFFVEMKIIIYSRPQISHTTEELNTLMDAIVDHNFEYTINNEFADIIEQHLSIKISDSCRYETLNNEGHVDTIMLSYGGDGTFLEAVKLLKGQPIPILGVNSGRLGFLANVPKHEIDQTFDELSKGNFTISTRSLIEIDGDLSSDVKFPFAFNEFTIQRKMASMISVETYINNEMVATYWGDGILISTPSGSTAYSLSLGGPIVVPTCECFVLSPIAPHNLTMRPIVIPDSCEVIFKVASRDDRVAITIDNLSFNINSGSTFSLKKAENQINLIQLQNISFYDTLRNKMLWGIDPREHSK